MSAPQPSYEAFMQQLKVCGTCRALLLAANVVEHKQWHLEQIELAQALVEATPPARWRFPLTFGPRPVKP